MTPSMPWLLAAAALMLGLIPLGTVALRGAPGDRLVGLEMAAVLVTLILLALAEGEKRPAYYDEALALALLVFGGGLVFARFLERWL